MHTHLVVVHHFFNGNVFTVQGFQDVYKNSQHAELTLCRELFVDFLCTAVHFASLMFVKFNIVTILFY